MSDTHRISKWDMDVKVSMQDDSSPCVGLSG